MGGRSSVRKNKARRKYSGRHVYFEVSPYFAPHPGWMDTYQRGDGAREEHDVKGVHRALSARGRLPSVLWEHLQDRLEAGVEVLRKDEKAPRQSVGRGSSSSSILGRVSTSTSVCGMRSKTASLIEK